MERIKLTASRLHKKLLGVMFVGFRVRQILTILTPNGHLFELHRRSFSILSLTSVTVSMTLKCHVGTDKT